MSSGSASPMLGYDNVSGDFYEKYNRNYLSASGNTPGHINHWSSTKFIATLSERFEVLAVRKSAAMDYGSLPAARSASGLGE